ncbi:MAG: tripartite tricarboxylate transporter substrate binding protein [Candidimonas sp.]
MQHASPRRLRTLCSLALSGLALAWLPAHGASYPERPVTVVVPYSAGGDADVAARTLSANLRDKVTQPLVILNKGGAGGAIGSQFVRDAAPDGYTLLLGRVGSQAILPALQPGLSYKWGDFTILGKLDLNPMVCAVHGESAHTTLDSLLKEIKERPGKLNYATTGPATALNLAAQTLLSSADLPKTAAVEIPYKGGADATTALLSKEVDFMCNNLASLLGNIQAGRLRALVTTSPERLADLPDVPTPGEVGHKKLEDVNGWSALYGPPNLPQDVVAYWRENLAYLSTNPQWVKTVEGAGSIPRILSPDASREFVEQQFNFYRQLGQALDIEIK